MAKDSFVKQLLGEVGFYKKSMAFYAVIGVIAGGFVWYQQSTKLIADEPVSDTYSFADAANTINYSLKTNGNLYAEKVKLDAETKYISSDTYFVRYPIINGLKDPIDELTINVFLPKPATEAIISHTIKQNGGVYQEDSYLSDPQTLTFVLSGISNEAQASIEFRVPRSFVQTSIFSKLKEQAGNSKIWIAVSVVPPILLLIIYIVIVLAKNRRPVASESYKTGELPSRLKPALLEILIGGRLTSRGLAASLIDLARRGHLTIIQTKGTDYRFVRRQSSDQIDEFEEEILFQLFGPLGNRATTEEINLSLASEVFSKRVSKAYNLAYEEMRDLGYYSNSPLALHRRYLILSVVSFVLAIVGFSANLVIFSDFKFVLIFWVIMMVLSVAIGYSSKDIPARSQLGTDELAKWLGFRQYLSLKDRAPFTAFNQGQYFTYLPYAIVMSEEVLWTGRYSGMPFMLPEWYVTPTVATIEEFANNIFPMFGYLSYIMSASVNPNDK